jgi:6-phosphogluconolactonase
MTDDRMVEASGEPGRPEGPDAAGEPEVLVRPDEMAAAAAAAARIAEALAAAIEARGVAHWATTGGSAPGPVYRALVAPPLRDRVDWSRVEVWFGDDRFVPRADPLSNVRLVDRILIAPGGGVGIAPEHLHVVPVDAVLADGGGPAEAARRYAAELASRVPTVDGWPAFDLVIVGVGPDGHVLSVFPGSEAFDATATVLPIPAPTHVEPHVPRVTLNPAILDVAGTVLAIAFSGSKAMVCEDVFGELRDVRQVPAQLVRRAGATWCLDEAAAADLPAGVTIDRG